MSKFACSLSVEDLCCATARKPKKRYIRSLADPTLENHIPNSNIGMSGILPALVSQEQREFTKKFNDKRGCRKLIPVQLSKHPNTGEMYYCRIEELKSMFPSIDIYREVNRCAIPCTGFYHWPNRVYNVVPTFFYNMQNVVDDLVANKSTYSSKDGWTGIKLVYLAGIYRDSTEEGNNMKKLILLSNAVDPQFSDVHWRMPVVLQTEQDLSKWINIKSHPTVDLDPNDIFVRCLNRYIVDKTIMTTDHNSTLCFLPDESSQPRLSLPQSGSPTATASTTIDECPYESSNDSADLPNYFEFMNLNKSQGCEDSSGPCTSTPLKRGIEEAEEEEGKKLKLN